MSETLHGISIIEMVLPIKPFQPQINVIFSAPPQHFWLYRTWIYGAYDDSSSSDTGRKKWCSERLFRLNSTFLAQYMGDGSGAAWLLEVIAGGVIIKPFFLRSRKQSVSERQDCQSCRQEDICHHIGKELHTPFLHTLSINFPASPSLRREECLGLYQGLSSFCLDADTLDCKPGDLNCRNTWNWWTTLKANQRVDSWW